MSGMICHMGSPLLMVFPSLRRCCRVPLQGLSGCIWRMRSQSRARRLTPSCVLAQSPSPGLLSSLPTKSTVPQWPWKTALFSCDSCQWAITTKNSSAFQAGEPQQPFDRGGLIYDSSNLVPEIHWNNRRFKCSHALNHGCRYVLHKSTYICI